jgi:peroxiredoxin Q/BCP
MPVSVGTTVADLTVRLHTGEDTTLSALANGQSLVVFFYPKALSAGCTAQACNFRDLAGEFAQVNAQRVGISRDSVDTQQRFATKNAFDFPLIADPDGVVAEAFGAKQLGPLRPRQTYVLDANLTVQHVIRDQIRMDRHADEALNVLRSQNA